MVLPMRPVTRGNSEELRLAKELLSELLATYESAVYATSWKKAFSDDLRLEIRKALRKGRAEMSIAELYDHVCLLEHIASDALKASLEQRLSML